MPAWVGWGAPHVGRRQGGMGNAQLTHAPLPVPWRARPLAEHDKCREDSSNDQYDTQVSLFENTIRVNCYCDYELARAANEVTAAQDREHPHTLPTRPPAHC